MKKFFASFLLICMIFSLVACDGDHTHTFSEKWVYDENNHWHECDGKTCKEVSDKASHEWVDKGVITEATPDSNGVLEKECSVCGAKANTSIVYAGLSEEKWNTMLSDANFENYTLTMEGTMTATDQGMPDTTSNVKSIIKMTEDKMALDILNDDILGDLLFDGEIAEAQKIQYSQVFMTLLEDYKNFTYDAETDTYKVTTNVRIEKVLKGIIIENGETPTLFDIPTVLEMREAEVTVSGDGKLLKFVCDYSQTMDVGGGEMSFSGITTWTFSDYGTTVIE